MVELDRIILGGGCAILLITGWSPVNGRNFDDELVEEETEEGRIENRC
jgi:hypothetical protein